MSKLFEPWPLRAATARNRIVVSPMCQYSALEGLANPWHAVHLGTRAVGGAGVVCTEATAVTPEGRISPMDLGIWNDAQRDVLAPITAFIRAQGALPAIQLAHAGRKGSTAVPWKGHGKVDVAEGGWQTLAPSALPYGDGYPDPRAMTEAELSEVTAAFVAAARRADAAGFEIVELHAAHGYLLHTFLSPISNHRTDAYGGSLENRSRLLVDVARAVRAAWPEQKALWVRISATDWAPGGFELEEAVQVCRALEAAGVDAIDTSSGGLDPRQKIPVGPGYQAHLAARIRKDAAISTIAVGMITGAAQAEVLLNDGSCDAVALARELLRDPYWPLHAARALGVDVPWPVQYARARP
jgi:2,4-dienoyl-CoA reductase-like NADH-dependent reductase (Old Yellow Enzyme family)